MSFWSNSTITADSVTVKENVIEFENFTGGNIVKHYTGYLKFKLDTPYDGFDIQIDGVRLTELEFEGYVKEKITITLGISVTINFIEFSLSRFNTQISQDTKDFYSNIPEGNDDAWGELIVKNLEIIEYKQFNWYEPEENDSFDKMEFWNNDYVTEVPNLASCFVIDSFNSDNPQPSGYKNLQFTRSSNILPILIHENDIGKKNTIGPLKDNKGNEIYINLTII